MTERIRDIVLINKIGLDPKGVYVTATIEDVSYVRGSQSLYDPPEYAPARCTVVVPFEDLPELPYESMDEDELEQVLNVHANLNIYDWVIDNDYE